MNTKQDLRSAEILELAEHELFVSSQTITKKILTELSNHKCNYSEEIVRSVVEKVIGRLGHKNGMLINKNQQHNIVTMSLEYLLDDLFMFSTVVHWIRTKVFGVTDPEPILHQPRLLTDAEKVNLAEVLTEALKDSNRPVDLVLKRVIVEYHNGTGALYEVITRVLAQ